MAGAAAEVTGGRIDVVVSAKIRAPHQPELGLGAMAPDGTVILDEELVRSLGVTDEYLQQEIRERLEDVARRTVSYRGDRELPSVEGGRAVIVDDGIATGGTVIATARWLRRMGPAELLLGVPVAPPAIIPRLKQEVDQVVALLTPEAFVAVGGWYREFDQVTDEEVRRTLTGAAL